MKSSKKGQSRTNQSTQSSVSTFIPASSALPPCPSSTTPGPRLPLFRPFSPSMPPPFSPSIPPPFSPSIPPPFSPSIPPPFSPSIPPPFGPSFPPPFSPSSLYQSPPPTMLSTSSSVPCRPFNLIRLSTTTISPSHPPYYPNTNIPPPFYQNTNIPPSLFPNSATIIRPPFYPNINTLQSFNNFQNYPPFYYNLTNTLPYSSSPDIIFTVPNSYVPNCQPQNNYVMHNYLPRPAYIYPSYHEDQASIIYDLSLHMRPSNQLYPPFRYNTQLEDPKREADPSLNFTQVSIRELLLYARNQEYPFQDQQIPPIDVPTTPKHHLPPGIPFIGKFVDDAEIRESIEISRPPERQQTANVEYILPVLPEYQQTANTQNQLPISALSERQQPVNVQTDSVQQLTVTRPNLTTIPMQSQNQQQVSKEPFRPHDGEQQSWYPSSREHVVAKKYECSSSKRPPRYRPRLADLKDSSVEADNQSKVLIKSEKPAQDPQKLLKGKIVRNSDKRPSQQFQETKTKNISEKLPSKPIREFQPLLNVSLHASPSAKKSGDLEKQKKVILISNKKPHPLRTLGQMKLSVAKRHIKQDCWKKPFYILRKQTHPSNQSSVQGFEEQRSLFEAPTSKRYSFNRKSSLGKIFEVSEKPIPSSTLPPFNKETMSIRDQNKNKEPSFSKDSKGPFKKTITILKREKLPAPKESIKGDNDPRIPKSQENQERSELIIQDQKNKLPTVLITEDRKAQQLPGMLKKLPSVPVQESKHMSGLSDLEAPKYSSVLLTRDSSDNLKIGLDPEKPLPENKNISLDIGREYSFRRLFAPNEVTELPDYKSAKIEMQSNNSLFTIDGPNYPSFEVLPFGVKMGTVPPFPQPRPQDLPPYDQFPGSAPPQPSFCSPTSTDTLLPCYPYTGPVAVDGPPLCSDSDITYTSPAVPIAQCGNPALASKVVRLKGPVSRCIKNNKLWQCFEIQDLP